MMAVNSCLQRAGALCFSLCLSASVCFGQTSIFDLQIPDFGDQIFDGNVIEAPGKHPRVLLIRIRNPEAAEIDYGKITTRLNGQSAGFITSIASSAIGKVARMDLKLRAGMSLLPGTNTVEITAANRRGRKYYRNFVLKTKEDSRNEYFAYDMATVPGDEAGAPPDVLVLEPEFPIVLEAGEKKRNVRVKASIAAVHPLDSVRVHGVKVDAAGDRLEIEREVTITPEDTRLSLQAVDRMGNRTAVTIPVSRTQQARPTAGAGERYALVVGIARYGVKPGLPDLSCASLDARNFAELLERRAGFKRENIMLLTDSGASNAQLRNAFRNFPVRPKSDDLFVVYFAGYGLHDPADPEKIYLAAHDTQLSQLADTALYLEDLKTVLGPVVRSRQTFLLFDVGRAGAGSWAERGNNLVNDYLLRMFANDPSKAVLVGSGVNEVSSERAGRSGAFTQALVDAAQGKADWNRDGAITAREWFQYVARVVRAESRGAQNPRYTLQRPDSVIFLASR